MINRRAAFWCWLKKKDSVWTVFLLIVIFFILFGDVSGFISEGTQKNIASAAKFLNFIVAAIIIWFVVQAMITRKYSIRLEKLTFGGVNLLFNTTSTLYINSVVNFLDTKRSLFKIMPEFDNFSEVFDSYYQTYAFFRQEMKILDPKNDMELYAVTNEILFELNKFLTKNQNNYRRWYKFVSESDKPIDWIPNNESNDRFFYNTPIGEIQRGYYDYDRLVSEFREINLFFSGKVRSEFGVNIKKWDWD